MTQSSFRQWTPLNSSSSQSSKQPYRFVLLHHDVPSDSLGDRGNHFDLMLECDSALWTWAINRLPKVGETVVATRLPDHRKAYLDYEGPISSGRGSVKCTRNGIYTVLKSTAANLLVCLDDNNQKITLCIDLASQPATITCVEASTRQPDD